MSGPDVVVVGAGMAGLTCAREIATGGADVLLLDRGTVGGQVSTVDAIRNAPGHPVPIAGYDLGALLMEQAEAAGAAVALADVTAVVPDGDRYRLHADGGAEFGATAVVLAGGSVRRRLGVPGEQQLTGRGVTRCASCDGPLLRDLDVVVVGGGDSAMDEAAVLAGYANRVLIVHHGPVPTARDELVARTAALPNVTFRAGAGVVAVDGADRVRSVVVRDLGTGAETEEPADGLLVQIGLEPDTGWLADLVRRDGTGRLVVDEDLTTSRPGIVAAGDLRTGSAALLTDSAADGGTAARTVLRHLARRPRWG
ncbi:FAD-dependent oxidoreductase [Pseudonocardia sp. NPDC046786]|uniref:NAD(P)/FAD-dependent oxidoreductase n=1 Tax=Pseudonocardia sp. NPDC046786 TaxID=3155471 RepID=UPI00340E027D